MSVNLGVVGKKLEPSLYEYTERDVILYALGVGCGRGVLAFVYEQDLEVLPTFAVIPAFPALFAMGGATDVNPMMVLHGEQRIELCAPIPTSGEADHDADRLGDLRQGKGRARGDRHRDRRRQGEAPLQEHVRRVCARRGRLRRRPRSERPAERAARSQAAIARSR